MGCKSGWSLQRGMSLFSVLREGPRPFTEGLRSPLQAPGSPAPQEIKGGSALFLQTESRGE